MTVYDRPFGRYLEDFVPGDIYRHWPGKTITEADDHLFCMITMNHHPLHTNAWFAENETVQGKNVVVGNLVYSLALGMSVPDVSGSCIANLEVESLLHRSPTFHGDTIYAETRVLDATPSKSKDDRGIVTVETKAFNQRGEEVCYFRRKVMVWKARRRTGAAAALRRRRLGLRRRRSPADRVRRFRHRLLEWGDDHRRDLPWRRTRDPWRILVSEVMLQQTQVDRVVPHYERFVAAFATPAACARARPADVVRLWSGLGYNRRALQPAPRGGHGRRRARRDGAPSGRRAARARRASGPTRHVPSVPSPSGTTWRPWTPMPCGCWRAAWPGAPLTVGAATRLGDRLVPPGLSWEFNQTMFDLGATVCTGSRPTAPAAPCAASARGDVGGGRPAPIRGGSARRRGVRARSPARTARGGAGCCTRSGPAAWSGPPWPTPAAGRTTPAAPSWSRRRWWPRGSRGGPAGPGRSSGWSDRRRSRARDRRRYTAVRNPMIRRLTTSGCSRWTKWPAPSTTSSSDPRP